MIPREIAAENVDAALEQIVQSVATRDYSDVLASCHFQILEGVAENFTREENRFGEAWPKRKDDKTHPLLRLTYAMYVAAATHGGAGQVERINAQTSELGISLDAIPYARAQNLGYPEGNLPAREYYYIDDETEERLSEIVESAVFEGLV